MHDPRPPSPLSASMGRPLLAAILLTLALLPAGSSTQCSNCTPSSSDGFATAIKSTIDEVSKLLSLVATFSGAIPGGSDLRTSSAVQDCADLLDLSSDELSLVLSATENSYPASTGGGATGHRIHDLQSWVSGALANQDTCSEGLQGTDNELVKGLIMGGVDTITTLLTQVLPKIPSFSGGGGRGNRKLMSSTGTDGMPYWLGAADRRLLQVPASGIQADAVVAADGSGDYATVSEAVEAAPEKSTKRFVIYVKKGVYNENVEIKKKKWNIAMVGDGMGSTVITGSRNFVDGWTTFRTATVAVSGLGFIARDITFENTAGPSKHQAVAFRSSSDLSAYLRCEFKGYQDTLYAHSLRNFFRECRISGTVDFIFGNAAAVFQNCQILARLPGPNQKNTITAQGRKDPNQNTGFTLQYCNVTADGDLAATSGKRPQTYLGRPWKAYSRTVFMQSYLSDVVEPEGWLPWDGEFALSTLYYGEYMNSGPGSGTGGRVTWPGYRVITNAAEAIKFSVAQFIDGNDWLPATGVTYTAGLGQ